jgi:hypothetical protein
MISSAVQLILLADTDHVVFDSLTSCPIVITTRARFVVGSRGIIVGLGTRSNDFFGDGQTCLRTDWTNKSCQLTAVSYQPVRQGHRFEPHYRSSLRLTGSRANRKMTLLV